MEYVSDMMLCCVLHECVKYFIIQYFAAQHCIVSCGVL